MRVLRDWYSVPLLLVVYELLSRSGLVSSRTLPSLVRIGGELWTYLVNGVLLYHAGISLYRAAFGFALALVVGVLLGTLMARSRWGGALSRMRSEEHTSGLQSPCNLGCRLLLV